MTFLETLRKNLTPEQYTLVTDALGDDFDFDLVPRSRLNKVIKQRNELREQLAGGSQPQSTRDSDDSEDVESPSKGGSKSATSPVDIKELEKQWQKRQDEAVQAVKIQYAALEKLRAANAIDAELIFNGGLVDKSKLSLNEAGDLVGMDDLITELQKSKAHLFTQSSASKDTPAGTGKKSGTEPPSVSTLDDYLKLDADKQIAFKEANPTLFQKFMQQQI